MAFTSQGLDINVMWKMCDDPDCTCQVISFFLSPPQGSPLAPHIDLDVDMAMECEVDAHKRTEAETAVVEDFMRHGRAGLFAQVREGWREAKRTRKRVNEYVIDPREVESGTLVLYSSIIDEAGSILEGGQSCSFTFTHQGRRYYAEDLYCPKPGCKCHEFGLIVLGPVSAEGQEVLDGLFFAKITTRGKVTIANITRPDLIDQKGAEVLIRSLREQTPDMLPDMRERARTVTAIGARSLAAAKRAASAPRTAAATQVASAPRTAVVPFAGSPVERSATKSEVLPPRVADAPSPVITTGEKRKVGRNDPCPCNSGKKYKKCCGAG